MATTSRIGMEMPNGEVKSIYCHWDGYPEGVGATLQEHYTNPEKVEALIALGDISSLSRCVSVNIPGVTHTFDNPDPDVTVAYHRDRGEKILAPSIDPDVRNFAKSFYEQYAYVFTQQGEWKTLSLKD